MTLFEHDQYILYICAAVLILLTIILVKLSIDKYDFHRETARKFLHLVAVITCAFVVYHAPSRLELAVIFFVSSIALFIVAYQNVLLPSPRKSYGIALFPLSFALLLVSSFTTQNIIFGIITLGISDALAGISGEYFAKKKHLFLYEQKSWLGFAAFYFSTLGIGYFFIGFTPLLFILVLVPALSELFSYRGSDNFTIPLVATLWISVISDTTNTTQSWIVFLCMLFIMGMVYHKKWLSMAGTTAAVLLGSMIIFAVGPIYLIPISIFFIVGSLTSKLHPKSKDASGRNAFQVFANGLIAVLCMMAFAMTKNDMYILASFASVAVSFADTISSDIGIYFKHKTYDITTMRPVKVGLSGGISLVGTLAGILASVIFALIVGYIFNLGNDERLIIAIAGASGMILDSILGSLWQAKYQQNDDITEEKTYSNILIKGFSWLNNDGVNLLANVIVVSFIVWMSIGFY
jgi:uncharacterized protein (TIGR00297 family)